MIFFLIIFFFLGDERTSSQHFLVAILEGEHFRATFRQQNYSGGCTQGWAEVLHAATLGIGAGARVHKESACG